MKKKTMGLLIALVLVLTCAVGGTLAWLTTQTGEVVNTFTVGDINIELYETENDKEVMSKNYKMVPGTKLDKDPTVEVEKGSEPCWVFVEVKEANGVVEYTKADGTTATTTFDSFLEYKMASDWVKLGDNYPGIYYYKEVVNVLDAENNKIIPVLKDNTITVNGTVTKEMLDAVPDSAKPTLSFVAYASQAANDTAQFTAEQAWNNISE